MEVQPGVAAPAAGVPAGTQPPSAPVAPAQTQNAAASPQAGAQPGGVPQSPAPPAQVQVPLEVVKAIRDEAQQAKQRAEQLEQQLNVFRANVGAFQQNAGYQQPQQAQQQPQAPANPFEGMRDDDVVTIADVKKIVERLPSNAQPSSEPELRAMVAKLEVAQVDPHYEHTIRTFLPEVLAADPTLRHAIVASPNPLRTALSLSRTNPKFLAARQAAAGGGLQPQQPQTPLDQLALILQNLEKPGNPGQFGAAPIGAGSSGRFATMTDAEFEAHVRAVKGGI